MRSYIGGVTDEQVFWDALDFATEAHDDQWRKSGDAYILHPCSVAMILAAEMDIHHPEILAAALLHDTVEDVEEVTGAVVGKKFGKYVQAIVEGCTKVTQTSGDRQLQYKRIHRKIFSGAALRPEVMLVKLADRLHNLRTLYAMPKSKQQRIADETLDIYAPLATVFGLFNMKREMYNLALTYKFRKQWVKLAAHIDALRKSPDSHEIIETLRKRTVEEGCDARVDLRVKELWAYYDHNNHILLQEIDFPYEILIVVKNTSSCYQALGIVNQTFRPIPRTIRDFIANPKPTGYQGLHARAIIKGQKYLFKIRTENMARRAQRGLFRNWSSKNRNQRRFIHEIKELFGVIGSDESLSYRDVIAASGKKEIYTYTPKGDLICLPLNSTVLDFAFRVHTDIGHSCLGAMVGNKRKTADHVLKDGDVVRIIRSGKPLQFDPEMLEVVKVPRTRAELSKVFRGRKRQVAREVGRATLTQEMGRYGVPLDILTSFEMQQVYNFFSVKNGDELAEHLGDGRLRLPEIIHRLKLEFGLESLKTVAAGEEFNDVVLTTLDPVSIKLSSCCKPLPTEKNNMALLTRERLSVHRKNCPRLEEIKFHREDGINVSWNLRGTAIRKPQTMHILEAKRQRLMMIAGVAPRDMTIEELTVLSSAPTKTPAWQLIFKVPNLAVLRDVLNHFEKSSIQFEFEFDY
ncbi:MAG: HD domain-containing protein [Desulfocapsaceae bacterium]|nr:HD domain-containing protein [Desulfocapsaceae bacterium]